MFVDGHLGANVLALEGNRVWLNGVDSPIPHRGGSAPHAAWPLPESALATTPDPGAAARRRSRSRSGTLEQRLLDAGHTETASLARFIAGPGCGRCLQAAWKSGLADASPPPPVDDRLPQDGRLYRLVSDSFSDKVVFELTGHASLADRIWSFAVNTATTKTGSVKVIGVLGGTRGDPLETLAGDLRAIRAAERGDKTKLRAGSRFCRSAFNAFNRRRRRIGVPLMVDCEERVALGLAGAAPEHPLFQKETLGSSSVWRASLRLVRYVALTIGVIVLLLGALAYWQGFFGKVADAVVELWQQHPILTFSGIVLSVVVSYLSRAAKFIASLLHVANLFLPRLLRLKLHPKMKGVVRPYDWLESWFPEADDHKAALGWVRRRVFGAGSAQGLALLALRYPDRWSDDDVDRFRRLLNARPAHQGIVVVLSIRSPNQIASGLRPWVDPETRLRIEAFPADVELLILPDTPKPSLPTMKIDKPLRLLGVSVSDAAAQDRLCDDLRDDRLTITDIVPLLVFGSTPEMAFVIAFDAQNAEPSLDKVLAPFVQFVADTPDGTSLLFPVPDIQANIAASGCAWVHRQRVGTRTWLRFIGREMYRDELAVAIEPAFAGIDGGRAAYVRILAGCGQLFNLQQINVLLNRDEVSDETSDQIVRHLRAAAALSQQGAPFPAGSHRQEMLVAEWTKARDRLLAARVNVGGAAATRAAEMVGLVLGAAAMDPEQGRSSLLDLLRAGSPDDPGTVRGVFVKDVTECLSAQSALDPDYATRLLDRQLAGAWASFAAMARDTLMERLEALCAALPPLSERLAQASEEEFAALLQAHRGDLPRFMALCYCLAARSATDLPAQERLAATMLRHRAAGLRIDSNVTIGHPGDTPGNIIAHLSHDMTDAVINGTNPAVAEDSGADEMYLDSFEPHGREIRDIVNVMLKRSA